MILNNKSVCFKLCDFIVAYFSSHQDAASFWEKTAKNCSHKDSKHDQGQMFSSQFALQIIIRKLNYAEVVGAGQSSTLYKYTQQK